MYDADETAQFVQLLLPAAPTVLIVDDDELVLARLKELVVAAGYVARTALNGEDALQLLEQCPVSIVVADFNMPGMTGVDLCSRIRARVSPGYIYILLLTMRDTEKDILSGLDAGADDYLSKRMSSAQFMARLRVAKRVLDLEYSLQHALANKNQLAMTDELTGAFNRRYLMRHLGRKLKHTQHYGGDVALLLLDVDHFKKVNDTYGHAAGDVVLKELAKQIGLCLRSDKDWCARMGGEEFAVVLEDTPLAEARVCAERIRQAIADNAIVVDAGTIRVTVSLGVSGLEEIADREAATVLSLLELADSNLYVSKAAGRNRVSLSDARAPGAPKASRTKRTPDANSQIETCSLR